MNDDQLNDELDAFAHELGRVPLNADVRDRDQLLYRCGQASVAHQTEPRRREPMSGWLKQCLLVACSICTGAILMHRIDASRPQSTTEIAVNGSENTNPQDALTERLQELYSPDQIAAVRSNQILCASSNLDTFDRIEIVAGQHSPLPHAPAMRARAVDQFDLF